MGGVVVGGGEWCVVVVGGDGGGWWWMVVTGGWWWWVGLETPLDPPDPLPQHPRVLRQGFGIILCSIGQLEKHVEWL